MLPPEIQNGMIAFVVVALGYLGGWLQNRMQRNKQQTEFERQKAQIEAEAEAQNAKNQEAIRYTLTNYVNQIGRLDTDLRELRLNLGATQGALNSANSKLEAASVAVSELKAQNETQKTELDIFRENLGAAEQTIKELGDELLKKSIESQARDTQLADVTKRLETLEHERNTLREQLDKSNGELAAREKTIEEQRAELAKLSGKVERMQQQIEALQKKSTDELDPSKVPPTDPAQKATPPEPPST